MNRRTQAPPSAADFNARIARLSPEKRALVLQRLARTSGDLRFSPIVRAPRTSDLPLSFAQQRLWFLDRLLPDKTAYNVSAAWRLHGPLSVPALERSLTMLVARHEVLRTRFAERDGAPVQIVDTPGSIALPLTDLSSLAPAEQEAHAHRITDTEVRRPFDLDATHPLRVHLLRLAIDDNLLLVNVHHIAYDAWSVAILERELSATYSCFAKGQEPRLPALPIQYTDYAVWQREWLQDEIIEHQLTYWKTALANVSALDLPADRPRPSVATYQGASLEFELSASLAEALRALSLRAGATLFMTLLAAFQVLLYRYSGQHDIAVGTPVSGRSRTELESLIGFFINTVVLRTDLSGNPSFRQLLGLVRETALGAYSHQDLPFEKLVEEIAPARELSRNPLFQVMFVLQHARESAFELKDIEISPVRLASHSAKFDLLLSVDESAQGLRLRWEYASDLFDATTIARMAQHFRVLIEAIAADPEQRISKLPLLPDSERRRLLVEWNDTAVVYPGNRCLHDLLHEQVGRTPNAVAVEFGDEQLTYLQLNARANQLAHHLVSIGVEPEVMVGVCMERSIEMIVGLLAILKAGGAYLPLDPDYPRTRLEFMLSETQAPVLLTQQALLGQLPPYEGQILCLERDRTIIEAQPDTPPPCHVTAENLAYVIYTSGSTGKPKGILLPQTTLVNLMAWHGQSIAGGRVAQFTSISFDVSLQEILYALLSGRTLVIMDNDTRVRPEKLALFMQHNAITDVFIPNVVLEYLATAAIDNNHDMSMLVNIHQAGEALTITPAVRAFFEKYPACRLHNHYGPAESHVITAQVLSADCKPWPYKPAIGSPISNVRIYILDAHGEPVPVGVNGELCIAGAGLARGYLNRPELTLEKFIPDPFSTLPGARMYRTGDLSHHLADGNIEFVGRIDNQVKIRGFRIELGEIGNVLAEHASVRQAEVIAREDSPGDKCLVAYVVSANASLCEVEPLRAFLRERLPEYMLPAAYIVLESFPLTPNGKIDRRALPVPQYGLDTTCATFVPPRNALEEVIAGVWCEVLKLDRISVHDNFFELGGHSLLATQVLARLTKLTKIELSLRNFFAKPTVSVLAVATQSMLVTGLLPQSAPISMAPRTDDMPLSFAQQRLWFLDRLLPDKTAYNISSAWRLTGPVDALVLELSINALIARHETLRTRFAVREGAPVQVIGVPKALALPLMDFSAMAPDEREKRAREIADTQARQPFDLETGPLLRTQLLRLATEEHLLLFTVHHIVSDGWSMGVFERELSAIYAACSKGQDPPLPALPIQYADYAVWQRKWLRGAALVKQLSYWKNQLADAATLELPTDRPRPALPNYEGGHLAFDLSASLTGALKELGRREGATLFMTLLAVLQILLHRYSRQDDIVVGSPIAGRGRTEIEGLIGFFVNTLVLRTDTSGNPTFRGLLNQVRENALGAYTHQDLPFEKLVEELAPTRDLGRNPIFQVMFVLQNAPSVALAIENIKVEPVALEGRSAKLDLTLSVSDSAQGLHADWEYASELFDTSTIARLASHFERLLKEIVADPDRGIDELPLLMDTERHQLLVEWNNTAADYQRDHCIHQLFEEQAARTPEAVAVVFGNHHLTYSELNARANKLAHHLNSRRVGPNVLVGICLDRSHDLIISLLAILKAGGAYLPLDPAYPQERLVFMSEDAQLTLLLSSSALTDSISSVRTPRLLLDADADVVARSPEINILASTVNVRPTDPAYVIYTSGSSGQPKGVVVPHRAVVNFLSSMAREPGIHTDDVLLAVTTLSFDIAALELLLPLTCGATVVLATRDDAMDGRRLKVLMEQNHSTIMQATPTTWRMLLDTAWKPATSFKALVGGEALSAELARQLLARGVDLWNMYGPTETTIWSTCARIRDTTNRITIGRPIANTTVRITDAQGNPSPIGVPGELCIGGDGLALGYWNSPELTAEKFVPDPYSTVPGTSMYRTGDLARYLPDSSIEFLGRIDQQVKLRGFRIEPGEIAAVLSEHAAVRQATVVVRRAANDNPQLVAFVVPANNVSHSDLPQTLVRWIAGRLPAFMIPSAVVTLHEMPLTPNGKTDVAKLLDIPLEHKSLQKNTEPTPLESAILAIWRELLRHPKLTVEDDFFVFGGDSMLAMRMLARLERDLNLSLPPRAVMLGPTIRMLCNSLHNNDVLTTKHVPGFITVSRQPPTGNPVYCIPGVGGTAFSFQKLAEKMRTRRQILAIELHDLEVDPSVLESIPATAAAIIRYIRQVQPHGPYTVVGYSYGGHVAFEVVRALLDANQKVEVGILLDAYAPGVLQPLSGLMKLREHARQLSQLNLRGVADYLWFRVNRRLGLSYKTASRDDFELFAQISEAERRIRNTSRLCMRALNTYRPGTYAGRLSVVRAMDVNEWSKVEDPTGTLGWSSLCIGKIDVVALKCRHLDLFKDPYITDVAHQLDAVLDSSARSMRE